MVENNIRYLMYHFYLDYAIFIPSKMELVLEGFKILVQILTNQKRETFQSL